MTDLIARLEELEKAATPGPWAYVLDGQSWPLLVAGDDVIFSPQGANNESLADEVMCNDCQPKDGGILLCPRCAAERVRLERQLFGPTAKHSTTETDNRSQVLTIS